MFRLPVGVGRGVRIGRGRSNGVRVPVVASKLAGCRSFAIAKPVLVPGRFNGFRGRNWSDLCNPALGREFLYGPGSDRFEFDLGDASRITLNYMDFQHNRGVACVKHASLRFVFRWPWEIFLFRNFVVINLQQSHCCSFLNTYKEQWDKHKLYLQVSIVIVYSRTLISNWNVLCSTIGRNHSFNKQM
jgi:hypothetical protein